MAASAITALSWATSSDAPRACMTGIASFAYRSASSIAPTWIRVPASCAETSALVHGPSLPSASSSEASAQRRDSARSPRFSYMLAGPLQGELADPRLRVLAEPLDLLGVVVGHSPPGGEQHHRLCLRTRRTGAGRQLLEPLHRVAW